MTGTRPSSRDRTPVPNAPAPNDLPPPYSAVVGNPQYGFVVPPGQPLMPPGESHTQPGQPHMPPGQVFMPPGQSHMPPGYMQPGGSYMPKTCTAPGVYPHPTAATESQTQGQGEFIATSVPVGVVMAPAVGSEPTTVTCYNCGKVVTTRVTYKTAWHTHLVAGSICVMTMVCSLCCLGLVPYCFDTFKDAEHYCPNCNTFIGKNNKC